MTQASGGRSHHPLRMQAGDEHMHHLVHGIAPVGAAVVAMERFTIALNISADFAAAAMAKYGEVQYECAKALAIFYGSLKPGGNLAALRGFKQHVLGV